VWTDAYLGYGLISGFLNMVKKFQVPKNWKFLDQMSIYFSVESVMIQNHDGKPSDPFTYEESIV